MSKKFNSGQSLVEVVFVTSIIFVVLTGLVTGAIFTLKAVRYARDKSQAIQIAKRTLEEIKGQKQSSSFWSGLPSPDGCLNIVTHDSRFYSQTCYSGVVNSGDRYSAQVRVAVWWDNSPGAEPTESRNKVVINTNVSNWEK
jgi:type II secretory pathway pseudopilin PulG